MFWLRTLAYLMPLGLGFVGFLLFLEIEQLELPREGDALVTAIQEPIGSLDPLGAIDGVTREVRDLVFDPLLLRDENYLLQPHILDSWSFRSIVTLHCLTEEDAGEVEALIASGEYWPEGGLQLTQCRRQDEILTLSFSGFAGEVEERFLDQIDSEKLANFEVVTLNSDHSVETLFEAFLGFSIEKKRIRMVDFSDDRTATLFLEGDVEPFLEELNLYLDSNADLNPAIDREEPRSHVVAREAIFRFRNDVYWHDGQQLTTEDILFSIEQYAEEGKSSPLSGLFWFAESMERRGDFEIQVLCESLPSTEFVLETWEQLPVLPKHVFDEGVSSEGWARFLDLPLGTGPYRVTQRFRDGGVQLMAHESYFLGKPSQEELVYRRFDSLESKLLALRSFRIDALVPDDRFVLWSNRNPEVVQQVSSVSRFQHFILWNPEAEPYRDLEFRIALAEAVDHSKWTRESSDSFLVPIRGLFHPGLAFEPGPMELPERNLVRAADRLEALGLKYDEKRGIRRDQDGNPLKIRLLVNRDNSDHLFLASSVAEQWQDLGIQVEMAEISLSSIVLDHLVTGEFQAVLLSWEVPKGRDRFQAFHSRAGGEERGNLFGMDNRRVDQLIEELRLTSDPGELAKTANELQEEIVALQPCLFLAESGRSLWFRKGGIRAVPPKNVSLVGDEFPFVGMEGVNRSRPWWVRVQEEQSEQDESVP